MKEHPYSTEDLISFLLQEMNEVERQRLEAMILADDELVADLLELEDELMKQYADGTLDHRKRKRLEEVYAESLAAERHRDFYDQLVSYSKGATRTEKHFTRRPVRRVMVAAVAVFLFMSAAIIALILQGGHTRQELQEAKKGKDLARKKWERAEKDLSLARRSSEDGGNPPWSGIHTAYLSPQLLRDQHAFSPVKVSKSTEFLILKLKVEATKPSQFRIRVTTVDEVLIYSAGPVFLSYELDQPLVILPLPLQRIDSGDYLISVDSESSAGVYSPVEEFYFRLTKS